MKVQSTWRVWGLTSINLQMNRKGTERMPFILNYQFTINTQGRPHACELFTPNYFHSPIRSASVPSHSCFLTSHQLHGSKQFLESSTKYIVHGKLQNSDPKRTDSCTVYCYWQKLNNMINLTNSNYQYSQKAPTQGTKQSITPIRDDNKNIQQGK
jgi:hypothetical protein